MSIQLRKQLFLAVRDLPYKISNRSKDTSCVAKTKLLGELLSRAGLDCQVWKAIVKWNQTNIPDDLIQMTQRETVNHLFLKVLIPETKKWIILDPTWDKRFLGTLPVNDWDGISNTQLAYSSKKLELLSTIEEFDFRDFDPEDTFTKKLNKWYLSLAERNI